MQQHPSSSGDIFIVEDDPPVRDVLARLFQGRGYRVTCFADGASFSAAMRSERPACVLLDVHIPGKSGLDVLKELNARSHPSPIFIISGKGDIAMAVDAIRNGALDFIEKPFRGSDVVARVEEGIAVERKRQLAAQAATEMSLHFNGCERLTIRERDVLAVLAEGCTNKEAARRLGISYRTVEIHRARIMEKIGARNATDLMRIVLNPNRPH